MWIKSSLFVRIVYRLSSCPRTGSSWVISGWLRMECIASPTVFPYKRSTLLSCSSSELLQAGSDAQCETTGGDLSSYLLSRLLAESLCFWVSVSSHSNSINLYWEALVLPSQYLTLPQRLFCGRVWLLHMATTFEDQEILKQLLIFINNPVRISHKLC